MPQQLATTMVKSQLETNNILDARLVTALASTQRENFAPSAFKNASYVDAALPVTQTRFMSEPLSLARMLDCANVQAEESVLLIGDATGYTASVLSKLAKHVTVLEEEEAIEQALIRATSSLDNVTVVAGAWNSKPNLKLPVDAVIIEGAVDAIPSWLMQVLPEMARIITVEAKTQRVGAVSGLGVLVVYTKNDKALNAAYRGDVFVSKLLSFGKDSGFIF